MLQELKKVIDNEINKITLTEFVKEKYIAKDIVNMMREIEEIERVNNFRLEQISKILPDILILINSYNLKRCRFEVKFNDRPVCMETRNRRRLYTWNWIQENIANFYLNDIHICSMGIDDCSDDDIVTNLNRMSVRISRYIGYRYFL